MIDKILIGYRLEITPEFRSVCHLCESCDMSETPRKVELNTIIGSREHAIKAVNRYFDAAEANR